MTSDRWPRGRGARSPVGSAVVFVRAMASSDDGSFTFERERDLSLVDNAKDLIDKVEHALARIDRGSFGRCEACSGAIEAERLDALPYATLCLADARQRVRLR